MTNFLVFDPVWPNNKHDMGFMETLWPIFMMIGSKCCFQCLQALYLKFDLEKYFWTKHDPGWNITYNSWHKHSDQVLRRLTQSYCQPFLNFALVTYFLTHMTQFYSNKHSDPVSCLLSVHKLFVRFDLVYQRLIQETNSLLHESVHKLNFDDNTWQTLTSYKSSPKALRAWAKIISHNVLNWACKNSSSDTHDTHYTV